MLKNIKIYDYSINDYKLVKVYYKQFRDLTEFLQNILNERINPIFTTKASVSNDYSFTKTNSYQEAWELCRYTMDDGFDEFYSLFQKLNYKFTNSLKIINTFSPVGYCPSVPRYLKGIPTTMHCYREEYIDKVVNIYVNVAYSAFQSHEEIINRGVLVLNLINYLEKQNIKTCLSIFELSKTNKEIVCFELPIKTKDEKLNVKKCYFPLVHPSFLRRLCFRALELMPVQDREWNFGYGRPLEHNETTNLFEKLISNKMPKDNYKINKTVYLSTPEELGINGEDIYEDCENFIANINSNYHLFDELKKENRGLVK